ncbi:MAG: FeoA domain-containing protein [Magnetococcales bacterium]|nr:FeoA domain-containing protein [Magnetococcales bacterium]MBF0322262.1 FeoA domain-containing protein [Magnetococcales bacterium]
MRLEKEHRRDELMEMLWRLEERHDLTLDTLREYAPDPVYGEYLQEFSGNGLLRIEGTRIVLSDHGRKMARGLVRRHRLAERLIVDVLGRDAKDTEKAACEYEHVLAPELETAICTLLGHPRTCPHGSNIPEGECCRESRHSVETTVISLDHLPVGHLARIVYLNCADQSRMNRLLNVGFVPGADIRLLQRRPTLVVKLDSAQVALEENVALDIRVVPKNQAA